MNAVFKHKMETWSFVTTNVDPALDRLLPLGLTPPPLHRDKSAACRPPTLPTFFSPLLSTPLPQPSNALVLVFVSPPYELSLPSPNSSAAMLKSFPRRPRRGARVVFVTLRLFRDIEKITLVITKKKFSTFFQRDLCIGFHLLRISVIF